MTKEKMMEPTDSVSNFWGLLHMLQELVADKPGSTQLIFYPRFTAPGESVFVIAWEDSSQEAGGKVRLCHSNLYKLIDDAIAKFLELHPESEALYFDRRSRYLTIEERRARTSERERSEVFLGVGA
jgi:hypothetical protein